MNGHRRRGSASLAAAVTGLALLAALLPSAVAAGTLNTAMLDNGTCGHNLQLGSDPTASSSATPWFLLYGDGAAASYAMFIDGVSIGTFKTSDAYGDVCIGDTMVLAQGAHVLTGNELAPHSTYTVTPFSFSVDTIPPAVPVITSITVSATYNLQVSGTSDPSVSIRVYSGPSGLGGARATTSGTWYVATVPVAAGTYSITAVAIDEAGNVSARSTAVSVTVGSSATVPSAPTLTSATAGNGQVALAWSAPASNGGSAISGYRVYRGTSSGAETLLTTLGVVTSYTNTGLSNGSTYYYRVSALNSVGEGALSNELSATPVAAATVPSAPLNLAASSRRPHGVNLAWSAPASNGGSAISGYRVYRGTSSGAETLLTTLGVVTSYTDTATSKGTVYYYKVVAFNAVGTGPFSNESSAIAR